MALITSLSRFKESPWKNFATMAEWSQLPGELLHHISTFLPAEIDLLRFRSVCNPWRAAVPPRPFATPARFPILPNDGISNTSWGFHLSKRPVYYIAADGDGGDRSKGWIIKLELDNPNRTHLLHPLTQSLPQRGEPLPENFPKLFDYWGFHVKEVQFEYTLQYINYRPRAISIENAGSLYMEKVAVSCAGEGFTILTVHVSGKLAMYKSGDARWTLISDLPSPYDDVVFHDGDFYAVDCSGRAVMVDRNGAVPSVRMVAKPASGGHKKHLVECDGGLMLVDMFLTVGNGPDEYEFYDFNEEDQENGIISERAAKFKVFRLERSSETWEEVSSLGDWIVFLGDNVAFSAKISELKFGECKGNCIVFNDLFFTREDGEVMRRREIGVFDMESGNIGPISSHQEYPELFWPPPSWVYPAAPSVQGQLEQVDI